MGMLTPRLAMHARRLGRDWAALGPVRS